MFSEEDKFLHGVYDQLPLGVSIDDRSEIKRYVDKLLNDGVTDIYQYFIDNPDELYDLVMSIKLCSIFIKLPRLKNIMCLMLISIPGKTLNGKNFIARRLPVWQKEKPIKVSIGNL